MRKNGRKNQVVFKFSRKVKRLEKKKVFEKIGELEKSRND
jgi:hypothetical protein